VAGVRGKEKRERGKNNVSGKQLQPSVKKQEARPSLTGLLYFYRLYRLTALPPDYAG
jgi:hypothetical protein